ncbi:fumarylacetoacetate hydrolase family protein [Halobacillus massiliensis]|uniref:fumarylacetoacetate hydrolase family protein n=1 Tax=Halobacillus massiliensis TaxID=1926286 RepID=UPI0009E1A311|nr:fumarylacetoacetate hydrolase family protein [Halobacillus massiliensis]
MKLVRLSNAGKVQYGELRQEGIHLITGDIYGDWEYTGEIIAEKEAELLAPIEPGKVIGIGANYVGKESDLPEKLPELPVFFFKPSSSVVGPGAEIEIPELIEEVKFESELAVVIGKEMRNVEKEEVLDYIFGYTVGNDVTAPQFFHEDGHWTLGKSFDTFTPLGPCLETELDPSEISVKAYINGEEKQNSPTSLMIVPLKEMVSYLSKIMTLKPGDCILTGSPLGAHFISEGDDVECTIEQIGTLKNQLIRTSAAVSGNK